MFGYLVTIRLSGMECYTACKHCERGLEGPIRDEETVRRTLRLLINTSLLHSNKEFIQKITLDKFEMKTMFGKTGSKVFKKLYRDFPRLYV